MYARVTTFQGAPRRAANPELAERGFALARVQPGFKGAYVLTARETGETLTVTLWETKEQAEAVERIGAQLRAEGAREVGATTAPTGKVYEVTAQA
jgi:heme-degrading monooxygenase HmoA